MFDVRLNPRKVIQISILLIFFAGCQPITNESAENLTVTGTQVPEQVGVTPNAPSPTSSRSIFQDANLKATLTPSPISSPTQEPSLTPIPSETVTPTLWPTLPPDEAANKVLSLLEDNQNPDCLLPCWWGATPGQTRWQDIEPFLKSLAPEIYYSSSETSFGAEVHLPLPESAVEANNNLRAFYGWSESGVIHGIAIDSINISGYDPMTMMILYGVPDEVWLTTISEPREGVLPFQLVIVYQLQGISFRYYVDATRNGELVTACFEPGFVEEERPDLFPAAPRIFLWEPGQTKTIQEISPIPLERYFPLENKTDLTIRSFYEKFIDPDESPCIETPADLWKFLG